MADNRKEQERAELHRTIWGIADDLRGSVDGWDFKQYILGMLFTAIYPKTLRDISTAEKSRQETPNLNTRICLTRTQSKHAPDL